MKEVRRVIPAPTARPLMIGLLDIKLPTSLTVLPSAVVG
jgi:hypothetical protein